MLIRWISQFLQTQYTCNRKTSRWPVIIFYSILDATAYNAFVLWTKINSQLKTNNLHKRWMFLKDLGISLVTPYMGRRMCLLRNEPANATASKIKAGDSSGQSSSHSNQPADGQDAKFARHHVKITML